MKISGLFLLSAVGATSAFMHHTPHRYHNGHISTLRASTLDSVDEETKTTKKEQSPTSATTDTEDNVSFQSRIANSGVASAAAVATAAVNAAVSMKSLDAPDVDKSYIALDKSQNEIDEEGLPVVWWPPRATTATLFSLLLL